MDANKKDIVKSVLRFLLDEIEHSNLDVEQKESLDVARQCLESTYELDSGDRNAMTEAKDLYALFNISYEITEDVEKVAEEYKVLGNEFMKAGKYVDALELYTKAINLNPRSHVFYCNRAAAYSRLDKHWDAISDCKESIRINATAKAYGRLGVAFSNLKMYKDAKEAYAKAHELDPSNDTYEQNLKLADEYLQSQSTGNTGAAAAGAGGSFPGTNPFDFNSFMNNPALLNMASQMLSDPAFRNMVSGIMSTGPNGDPNIDAFVQVGQQLAQQMQATNPNLMDTLRQNFSSTVPSPSATSSDSPQEKPDSTHKPSEN